LRTAGRLAAVLLTAGLFGCSRSGRDSEPLALPDAYLIYAPQRDPEGHPRLSPSGLPVFDALPLDDERAVPFHKLFAVGFAGEMLRTDYLLKQFIRDVDAGGTKFSPGARAAAREPTVFVLQKPPAPPAGVGFAVTGFLGGPSDRARVPWVAVPVEPDRDSALTQTIAGKLARRIAATLAAGGDPGAGTAAIQATTATPLIEGYASAMEVIAREWRVGEGPRGALSPDAGTAAQRQIFASVRENRFVMGQGDDRQRLRPAREMLQDPGVAATILYRMAQSKGVGRRMAPAELYAPFVSQRVPAGVSPAAVLGPFRNFQAKLIAVWGRAVLRGAPPHDIAELVEAYAAELPAERSEVIRLFVVTTFGATVKPDGVTWKEGGDPAAALPELSALAAEVAAGRRSLRQALIAGK
jgi:hypothetical protein